MNKVSGRESDNLSPDPLQLPFFRSWRDFSGEVVQGSGPSHDSQAGFEPCSNFFKETTMTSNNHWKIPAPSPLVLLADDLQKVLDDWVNTLTEYRIPCMTASTLEGLDRGFALYKDDISAIILDGCIPGHSVNTIEFILNARSTGFTKPIVASSSLESYREMMVRAGCSHQAPKDEAAMLVAKLLGRTS